MRRGAEGRAGRDPPREPAFDLLERAPERAAVLLGMFPSLVAQTPYSPSATRVTERSQLCPLGALRCRNDDIPGRTTSIPTSSKVLCAVYGVIAIAALIATWSQNAAYFDNPGGFLLDFLNDSKVTPASRSLTVDIVLFFLAAAILMVVEARKHGVRFVWATSRAASRSRSA